jgi:Bacterial protein of unknown function (DUF903)
MNGVGSIKKSKSEGELMDGFVKITAAAIVLSMLSACASPRYIISTTTGTLIQAKGEPKLNKSTAMYEYEDLDGHSASIRQADVAQIAKR